jgi:hypothetical protein
VHGGARPGRPSQVRLGGRQTPPRYNGGPGERGRLGAAGPSAPNQARLADPLATKAGRASAAGGSDSHGSDPAGRPWAGRPDRQTGQLQVRLGGQLTRADNGPPVLKLQL